MSIRHRAEYRAAEIQAEADGRMTPEREAYREAWREKIAAYIARRLPITVDLSNIEGASSDHTDNRHN